MGPRGQIGSPLDHRALPPEFESRRGHIWKVFHLWLCFITFGGRSAHLAYQVHESGHKTQIIITNSYQDETPKTITQVISILQMKTSSSLCSLTS